MGLFWLIQRKLKEGTEKRENINRLQKEIDDTSKKAEELLTEERLSKKFDLEKSQEIDKLNKELTRKQELLEIAKKLK